MKRLTLDQAWDLCMKQWKWIIWHWRRDNALNIRNLKEAWCENNGYDIRGYGEFSVDGGGCFFCEYDAQNRDECQSCPAKLVDGGFGCQETGRSWEYEPEAFYKKLRELHKIYESQKK